MCIICNCGDNHKEADIFLGSFERARNAMRRAVDAMKVVSTVATTKDDRKRYDRTHKKMVRILRDWNRIEQEREAHIPSRFRMEMGKTRRGNDIAVELEPFVAVKLAIKLAKHELSEDEIEELKQELAE